MSINYFFQTSAKLWNVNEAIILYDQKERQTDLTYKQLLLEIKSDLKNVGRTQKSLNRYVLKALVEVDRLLKMRCLGVAASENPEEAVEGEQQQTIFNISNNISQSEQVNITNNINQPAVVRANKRRALNDETDETVVVGEGSSMYVISPPCIPVETLHKPKLRKLQIDVLNQFIRFGTSFSQTDLAAKTLYNNNKKEQKEHYSLKLLTVFDNVVDLLDSETQYGIFFQYMWNSKLIGDIQDDRREAFFNVVKYTLTSFHLVSRVPQINVSNHERTHFVENIIPSLLALGKSLDFIEFKWCESEFISSKTLSLKGCDYDLRSAPPSKLIDALGTLTTQNNMELIIVEASSGQSKENTTHSIEDTLKILECGTASLRKEAAHYNEASLSTFKELKVYGVHVIKSQVTLSEVSLDDETHWKCVELRSAKLPTTWNDKVGHVQYMELLATLFNACHENQRVQKQLMKENIGLITFSGPTIGSVIKESN